MRTNGKVIYIINNTGRMRWEFFVGRVAYFSFCWFVLFSRGNQMKMSYDNITSWHL